MRSKASSVVWLASAAALFGSACTAEVVDGEPGAAGSGQGGIGAAGSGAGATSTGAAGGGGTAGGPFAAVHPEDGIAENITLSVYSDGWGELLERFVVATETAVVIDVEEENPYSEPPAYYVYAEAEGYYTELYGCTKGQSIEVDLDRVPDRPRAITGVIFGTQSYFTDVYLAGQTIQLSGPGVQTSLSTDAQGRYGLEGLPPGTYRLNFEYQEEPIVIEVNHPTEDTDYADLFFAEPWQMS